ncbi:hypothetical protein EHP00_1291 [Ecytonucleospora hepatopenaei]|uniref:Uncharacterized protein n=1 Tax=Ecytonucleospora hepatopenaei TaxID=646526 RepID=A0A1W0E6R5_9MICR|nr:hypothetical protein EHP00_1291 [Ecytonucleospora hepatopenaei]
MKILLNGKGLHENIYDIFESFYKGNYKQLKIYYDKLVKLIRNKENIFKKRWDVFEDFEYYLSLRVILNRDFAIYPDPKLGESIVTQVLKINEITYCNYDNEKIVFSYDKKELKTDDIINIDLQHSFKQILLALKPLKYNCEKEGLSNLDLRIEEILYGFKQGKEILFHKIDEKNDLMKSFEDNACSLETVKSEKNILEKDNSKKRHVSLYKIKHNAFGGSSSE